LNVIDEGVFAQQLFSLHPSSFASVNKQVDNEPTGNLYLPPLSTMPRSFKVRYIPCPVQSCTRQFTNQGGLKNHIRMHRTPQSNRDLRAHQPPLKVDVNINKDAQEPHPEHQNHPQNPEKVAKEKITYHPLINGMSLLFYSPKFT
jgi:hypothetical protein